MRMLKWLGMSVVLLVSVPTLQAQGAAKEPTPEQLAAVKKAFEVLDGGYELRTDNLSKRTFHSFSLPRATKDPDLKKVPDVPFTFELDLSETHVTGAGLKELASLKQLTSLYLDLTNVTDEGVKELATLPQLSCLNLSSTQVTDAGLKELASLKQLNSLFLFRTKVTDAGLKQLQSALPKCEIRYEGTVEK